MDAKFLLRWDQYNNQLTEAFGSLRFQEDLVDVTLSCEGKMIKAHKMLLSACSEYFHEVFKENPCKHPVIVFKNVQYVDLKAIVDFVYCGEVNVLQGQLQSFLDTADMLEVKGLTEPEKNTDGVVIIDDMETNVIREQLQSSSRRSSTSSAKSSPARKRKLKNIEKPDKSPVHIQEVPASMIKDEPEDVEIIPTEVSEPVDPEVTKTKLHVDEPSKETPNNAGEKNAPQIEPKNTQKTTPSDNKGEPNAFVPLKKRKTAPVEENLKGSENAKALEKKNDSENPTEITTAQKKLAKSQFQIPKDLVVTSVNATPVEELFDFPTEEVNNESRSEDATTPVHENMIQDSVDDASSGTDAKTEPEIGQEAPDFPPEQTEQEPLVEEETKEPEFDYFGCEICQGEAKPVDLERIVFSHKCPICPCACFCSHLLKEHMKVIHGWFNVQRRFTQY